MEHMFTYRPVKLTLRRRIVRTFDGLAYDAYESVRRHLGTCAVLGIVYALIVTSALALTLAGHRPFVEAEHDAVYAGLYGVTCGGVMHAPHEVTFFTCN